jgi:hypothetical protein
LATEYVTAANNPSSMQRDWICAAASGESSTGGAETVSVADEDSVPDMTILRKRLGKVIIQP